MCLECQADLTALSLLSQILRTTVDRLAHKKARFNNGSDRAEISSVKTRGCGLSLKASSTTADRIWVSQPSSKDWMTFPQALFEELKSTEDVTALTVAAILT